MRKKVKVVIPIYKAELSELETISLNRVYSVLSDYTIVVIKPQSLNLDKLKADYPNLEYESFNDAFFDGFNGYNKLMLSSDLYKRFSDIEYILIYQLDAYIFEDRLDYFIEKGYDYIGAPWPVKRLYRTLLFSFFLNRKKRKYNKKNIPCRQNLYNKIGNGGLSLRKIDTFCAATEKHKAKIDFYISNIDTPLYNEDVFWAIEIPEFSYPSYKEALEFAFDKYPALCFRDNGNKLPMGCHGWYKWKWRNFWKQYISFS